MPGSTPATSQLDWLSSTTAMIVLSWSKATRDLLKACPGAGRGRSAGASGHSVSYLPATMVPSPSPPAPYHLSAGGMGIRTVGPSRVGVDRSQGCMQRHRHNEFIRFLNAVERQVRAGKLIHVVLDNYATHKHPKVM